MSDNLCRCGSGNEREELYDARGIFVDFVCPQVREEGEEQVPP